LGEVRIKFFQYQGMWVLHKDAISWEMLRDNGNCNVYNNVI
jgi:hypothetical protein